MLENKNLELLTCMKSFGHETSIDSSSLISVENASVETNIEYLFLN